MQPKEIVREISRISAWSSGPQTKIVIPGYKDLRSFSLGETMVLQKNLGLWWPAYWRLGNWRIVNPVPRSGQEHMAKWLRNQLDHGRIREILVVIPVVGLEPSCVSVFGDEMKERGYGDLDAGRVSQQT